jgi:hypothetical protein
MFNKISTAIVNLLKSNSLIQSVYNYEASNLEGFPAMTITPSANESEYSTTTENRRVYAFMVRLYVVRGSGADAENTCENTMRDLVDTVLDKLDKNFYFTDGAIQTQTGYTFLFMSSSPSQWGYAGRENEMRVAEIRVRVHFDVDTTLIS